MNVEVVSYRGEKTRFQGNDLRNCTKFVVVMHIVCVVKIKYVVSMQTLTSLWKDAMMLHKTQGFVHCPLRKNRYPLHVIYNPSVLQDQ